MVYTLILLVFALLAWATLMPRDVRSLIAELKRRQRLRLIRRYGSHGAAEVSKRVHKYAEEQGIEVELVEDVLKERHKMIVERIGRRRADEILGEPGPTERYF